MKKASYGLSRQTFLLAIIVFVIIVGGVVMFRGQSRSPSETSGKVIQPQARGEVVFISAEGFSPTQLTIKKGGTVTWLNQTSEFHWPASDLHPTHTIYPEFDPRQPISPGQSWSFTFQKVGTWGYHDHLRPIDRALVEVLE